MILEMEGLLAEVNEVFSNSEADGGFLTFANHRLKEVWIVQRFTVPGDDGWMLHCIPVENITHPDVNKLLLTIEKTWGITRENMASRLRGGLMLHSRPNRN